MYSPTAFQRSITIVNKAAEKINSTQQTKTRKSKQTNKQQAISVYTCFPVPTRKEGRKMANFCGWISVCTKRWKRVGKQVKKYKLFVVRVRREGREGEGWAQFFCLFCVTWYTENSAEKKKCDKHQPKKKNTGWGNGWTYRVALLVQSSNALDRDEEFQGYMACSYEKKRPWEKLLLSM